MKYRSFFILFSIICYFSVDNVYAQTAYIQVVSEPGVSVFLDGEFKGTTNAEFNGLIIQDIEPGDYTIRVVKEGFNPQEEDLSLSIGEVYRYRVSPFVPVIRISERGSEGEQSIDLQIGSLKIQSLPVEIRIRIDELSVNTDKTMDQWIAEDIPVGKYNAVFMRGNTRINHTIEIKKNQETHLFVNTLTNEVELRATTINSNPFETNTEWQRDTSTEIVEVTNPATGKTWMDRNLGASRAARSTNDSQAYGNLYEWGMSVEGMQNPCPGGFRIPTLEEWGAERRSWSSNNAAGAFSSPLKITVPGFRGSNNDFHDVGSKGYYWSSTYSNFHSRYLFLSSTNAGMSITGRIWGFSVRCIKD